MEHVHLGHTLDTVSGGDQSDALEEKGCAIMLGMFDDRPPSSLVSLAAGTPA
jgi:hypothetical protein